LGQCRKFRIEGRVQGVWFRESTRQQAERLGITGYAVNCPDGTVEVLACGDPDALTALADWLHMGPPMARVESVLATDCDAGCPERFTTG
jgi:acylphosphatase